MFSRSLPLLVAFLFLFQIHSYQAACKHRPHLQRPRHVVTTTNRVRPPPVRPNRLENVNLSKKRMFRFQKRDDPAEGDTTMAETTPGPDANGNIPEVHALSDVEASSTPVGPVPDPTNPAPSPSLAPTPTTAPTASATTATASPSASATVATGGSCTLGAYQCKSSNMGFQRCMYEGNWLDFDCAPGTVCYPDRAAAGGIGMCDFPPSAAAAAATPTANA